MSTLLAGSGTGSASAHVGSFSVAGLITSDSTTQLRSALTAAETEGDAAFLLSLNSPGGSPEAVNGAVEALSSATIPVIVWVGPGSRADSGATLVAETGDVLALAPDAELGAAHPISLADPIGSFHSPAEVIDGLASVRHRTAEPLAEDARLGHLSSGRALVAAGAADVLATGPSAALRAAAGRALSRPGIAGSFPAVDASTTASAPPGSLRQALADPDLVFTMLLAAVVLLGLWLSHPANPVLLLACVGVTAAAAAGMTLLPLSPIALPVAAAGILFLAVDLHTPTHGALTAVGAVLLALAGSQLVDTRLLDSGVDPILIAGTVLLVVAVYLALLPRLLEARRLPHGDPATQLLGRIGTVREPLAPEGTVWLEGSLWRAVATTSPITAGAAIRVVAVEGLTLTVAPDGAAKTSDRATG